MSDLIDNLDSVEQFMDYILEKIQVIAKLAKLVCDLDSKQERIRAEHESRDKK